MDLTYLIYFIGFAITAVLGTNKVAKLGKKREIGLDDVYMGMALGSIWFIVLLPLLVWNVSRATYIPPPRSYEEIQSNLKRLEKQNEELDKQLTEGEDE